MNNQFAPTKSKRIALMSLFIDTLGFIIIIPVLPNLLTFYHTDYFMMALGMVLYSVFAIFSAPLLGAISDKYGRKPVLLASVFTSFLSSLIIGFGNTVIIYIIGRIVNGIAAGNITTIQSILTDIAKDKKERTNNFALFGMIFGLGFIVGPALGARLLQWWIRMPFFVSAGICFINMLFIIRWMPETREVLEKAKKITIHLKHIFVDMFVSTEKKYYLTLMIITLAIMIYQTSFTLFLHQKFGVPGEFSGYVLGFFGLIMIINQWFLFKNFWLKYFSNKQLILMGIFWSFLCFAGAFFFNNMRVIIVLIWISNIFQSIFRPVFQTIIIGERHEDIGLINGNISNIMNLANIAWPLIGGVLIQAWISPFGLVALLVLIAYIYARMNKLHNVE